MTTEHFAIELFGKVPHRKSQLAASVAAEKAQRKKEQKEEAMLRKVNDSFKIIKDEPRDGNDFDEEKRISKREKSLRKKRKQDDLSDDDTEVKMTEPSRYKKGDTLHSLLHKKP